jgi:hypothetical protein
VQYEQTIKAESLVDVVAVLTSARLSALKILFLSFRRVAGHCRPLPCAVIHKAFSLLNTFEAMHFFEMI